MTKSFNVLIEKDSEGYFIASVPALPGCHTQAASLDTLLERIREAIALYQEVLLAQGAEINSLEFVGIQKVML